MDRAGSNLGPLQQATTAQELTGLRGSNRAMECRDRPQSSEHGRGLKELPLGPGWRTAGKCKLSLARKVEGSISIGMQMTGQD